jgi:hypothetical protein
MDVQLFPFVPSAEAATVETELNSFLSSAFQGPIPRSQEDFPLLKSSGRSTIFSLHLFKRMTKVRLCEVTVMLSKL